MFIDANEIITLIQAARDCEAKLPKEEQWIHVSDIAATLQRLIDDEGARQEAAMDKMAEDYEDEEYGRFEREDAAIEKQLSMQDWPGGV
jgi:hypothetical protein